MSFDLVLRGEAGRGPNGSDLHWNNRGFAVVVDDLLRLGMAFDLPHGVAFPSLPGSYDDHIGVDENGDEYGITSEGQAWLEEHEKLLRWHGDDDDRAGIPLHKLSSNDGWVVTGWEAATAIGCYWIARAQGYEHPESFDSLIPFLERAAAGDGFEVH
ncbi:hypothetical protein FB384_004918 [Prauserella sediminis]|uniref:Uncharacterized protein n=1 Tax=Prauserella sediminis TaxID=577680 RepID=A0A839XV82_9PSEU|nr:hypothetical protein [Prauserella sediminis]MBB3665959.1 hypothetical protein [Prauserella sediminis]